MKSHLNSLLQIGDRPDDPHNVMLMHHFLVSMGVFMSFGGLIWGSMSLAFGLTLQSLIPYSYVLLTIINFLFFERFKNFQLARSFQVLISLLLPFFFQWSLGGFIVSGAVMLWAMLALAAAFTFQSAWLNVRWLVAFLALTVVSGEHDDPAVSQLPPQSEQEFPDRIVRPADIGGVEFSYVGVDRVGQRVGVDGFGLG